MKSLSFRKDLIGVQEELLRFAYKLTADREDHSFHGQKPGTRFFVHSVPESPDSDEHNSADGFYRQTAEHSERSSAAQAPVHYLSSSRCDYSFYSDVCRRCETNLGISEDQGLQDQSLAVHDSSDSHHPPAFYAAPFQST